MPQGLEIRDEAGMVQFDGTTTMSLILAQIPITQSTGNISFTHQLISEKETFVFVDTVSSQYTILPEWEWTIVGSTCNIKYYNISLTQGKTVNAIIGVF